MEVNVKQRTEEWFDERKAVLLTASRFGDAMGIGRGKPFDFLNHILTDAKDDNEANSAMQHGIDMEPAIHEAYNLLTGNLTRECGFWKIASENNSMYGYIGASPDAIVLDNNSKTIGLCEFKAPFHAMYFGQACPNRIPRAYMAQMQGQMAISGVLWCDFMAVCVKTKEIVLKKVHFQPTYWKHLSNILLQFCQTLKVKKQ